MNLPELLKIAEAASEQAKTPQDQIKRSFTYGSSFTPDVAIELIKRLQEAEKDAARYRFLMLCNIAQMQSMKLEAGLAGIPMEEIIDKRVAAMNGGKE